MKTNNNDAEYNKPLMLFATHSFCYVSLALGVEVCAIAPFMIKTKNIANSRARREKGENRMIYE